MNRTGADMANDLRQHRHLLLGCEAIGWLHMAGKARPDFLRSHGGSGVSYKGWHKQLVPGWNNRLEWLRNGNSLEWPNSLVKFVTEYAEGHSLANLVGCLQAGHAMASGIEKNLPTKTSKYLRQDVTHMWLATAFGHPVRNLLADPPEVLRPGGWEALLQQIGALLDSLKELGTNQTSGVQHWWEWRESAIGKRGWLRLAFESTLAETRLPNNDVTLWDQSYVASALFKSAVAGLVLIQKKNEVWQELKPETRWRVLTIGFGADHYEARAVRIGDWTGARMEIERFFDDVRRLIEVDLAVGSLLYRDDQVLAFTFPGERFDDEKEKKDRSLDDSAADTLRAWIEGQVDQLAQKYKFETPPLCNLSTSTRSVISLAREAALARDRLAVPVHRPWQIPEIDEQTGHVCPVCRVRFNGCSGAGEADSKQRPCKVCRERRKGRLDSWLEEKRDTIWITELADDNDRVALLTFSFDLEPWLDGSRVDSLRAQSIPAWRRFNPTIGGKDNPIDLAKPSESLFEHVKSFVRNLQAAPSGGRARKLEDAVLASINEGFAHEDDLGVFYRKMVEDRADNPPAFNEAEQDPAIAAQWLVYQLFRKNASPGRVYRFWRTAETFFDELIPTFREIAAAHRNRWRTRRLMIKPTEDSATGWQDRETYATRWNEAPVNLLYREESKDFLTVCNLARLLRPEEHSGKLHGVEWHMEGEDGKRRPLKVARVLDAPDLGVYAPLIVLDRSPLRFRVLVPLNAAGACVDAAVKKWEEEFCRVWDRMPLRVGIVAFRRMTPFQAVIEAARNLEDNLSQREDRSWRVVKSHVRDGVAALLMARPDGEHELVTVPVAYPDGRADDHYPYVAVTEQSARYTRDFTRPASKGGKAQLYRHVADLAPGDGVAVTPSRFAIVFLDSTARRFETADVGYLAEWRQLRETWDLLCRTAPSVTALRGAWAALAAARERGNAGEQTWHEKSATWASLLRSVLANHLEASPTELDALVDAARSGVLEKTLDWHLTILKDDLEVRI